MKNGATGWIGTGALCVSLISGCGKAPDDSSAAATRGTTDIRQAGVEDTVGIYLTELDKMADLFSKVRDEASARKHAPAIKACSDRLQHCADRLGEANQTETGMAFAAQAQRFMDLQQRMMPELGRIGADPVLAAHLSDSMKIPSIQPGGRKSGR